MYNSIRKSLPENVGSLSKRAIFLGVPRIFINAAILLFYIAWGTVSCNYPQTMNEKLGKKTRTFVVKEETVVNMNDSTGKSGVSILMLDDSLVVQGNYDLSQFASDSAAKKLDFEKIKEILGPVLQKGNFPTVFILGVRTHKDTTLYDYYDVKRTIRTIKQTEVKTYSFD
jgi:hypothetical protein